jgi:hypothetical protein
MGISCTAGAEKGSFLSGKMQDKAARGSGARPVLNLTGPENRTLTF